MKLERRWTVSNILSLSRIVLLVPVVLLILKQDPSYRVAVLALMTAAVLTDFLDGLLARTLNQVTDFGKLLDPLADKICIITVTAALVFAGDVPLWYAVIVVLRDLIIVAGSSVILTKRKVVVQSVWTGKFTVNFIAGYIILATMRLNVLSLPKTVFLYLSTAAVFVSLGVYFRVYQKMMTNNGIA